MVKKQMSIVSREGMEVLKGVAILAVLGIHLLWWQDPGIFWGEDTQLWAVSADQVLRFCVPLFVLLSALGLGLKYRDKEVDSWRFLKGRAVKILPRYFYWSFISFVMLGFVLSPLPAWEQLPEMVRQFGMNLVKGQADYHLYFVPMIFQFYVLFPVLLWMSRKNVKLTVWLGIIIQAVALGVYWLGRIEGWNYRIFHSDYPQYILFVSWLGYFVLGLWLAQKKRIEAVLVWLMLAVMGLVASVWSSLRMMESGVGLITATGFTRLTVMSYAMGSCIAGLHLLRPLFGNPIFQWLGRYSFLLYLCHVLYLRVIFGVLRGEYSPIQLVLAGGLVVGATILYVKWFKL